MADGGVGVVAGTLVVGVLSLLLLHYEDAKKRQFICDRDLWERYEHDEFEGFDNETGIATGDLIVPNHVHFLRMGPYLREVKFLDAMCLLAAFKNQRPERIYIHTDHDGFNGTHWTYLMEKVDGFRETVVLVKTQLPKAVFNQTFSREYHYYHSSDVLRIGILLEYGGIFLDNDSFLVRSLDPYRKFEMAIAWDEGQFLGTQVLVAHRGARFLRLWRDSYRGHYYPSLWYFNAGEWPTVSILWSRPELVHRVRNLFGVHDLRNEIYGTVWPYWRDQYAVHLLTRHLEELMEICRVRFTGERSLTEGFVGGHANTLREMVKEVYEFGAAAASSTEALDQMNCRTP